MSRYRPPRPPSSPYITAAGYRLLETELKGLWERRADVVKHLAAAAAEGDRAAIRRMTGLLVQWRRRSGPAAALREWRGQGRAPKQKGAFGPLRCYS